MNKIIKKTTLLLLAVIALASSPVFASSISDDAKKAIKEYAAYHELVNRGFKLEMLDKVESPEDLYKVLLPYMVVDGVPLDNSLSFNGYNFRRHKNVRFTNVYGTIDELLNKGYKQEQLFYYPAAGKEMYRVGNFVWEPVKNITGPYQDAAYYTRPFMGENITYFYAGFISQDFFKPYMKLIKSKMAIVVDCRGASYGWGGQFFRLGESLCTSNYKGKVILIVDKNTGSNVENDIVYNMRDSYYINGNHKKINFEWIVVGENTSGSSTYFTNKNWNHQVGELNFSPLPDKKNEWITSKEGEGVEPNIWALGEDDVNKTIEFLTGETDFKNLIKDVTTFRNYLSLGEHQLWDWPLKLPESFKKIKSNEEYNASVTRMIDATIKFKTVMGDPNDFANLPVYYEFPKSAQKVKNPSDFENAYIMYMESRTKMASHLKEHKNEYKNAYWIWWELPEGISSCSSFTDYAKYFSRWIDMRLEWLDFLSDKADTIRDNNIRIWQDAIKEEVKEWKDPEKHLLELSAYLKKTGEWIEYLVPEPFVIPKDYSKANIYGKMHSISPKIGEDCSAVPSAITALQKTDPELYVEKMVEYINSVAENDFEKVKLVFDIEQEILTYDSATYQKDLEVIDEAMKGVGENYERYNENRNALSKEKNLNRPSQDWKTSLEKGTCVCAGYSNLMQYFCYKLGIKCTVVQTPEEMIFASKGGHAWNIVKINGEHYILDATWGLDWLFAEPRYSVEKGHFPCKAEQQLLKKPMTLAEYKKLNNYTGNKK